VSKLLRGKEILFYNPGVDQGNYVVVLNADKVTVSGNKETENYITVIHNVLKFEN
jgi:large subunit ribosomal protein L13